MLISKLARIQGYRGISFLKFWRKIWCEERGEKKNRKKREKSLKGRVETKSYTQVEKRYISSYFYGTRGEKI